MGGEGLKKILHDDGWVFFELRLFSSLKNKEGSLSKFKKTIVHTHIYHLHLNMLIVFVLTDWMKNSVFFLK